MPPSTVTSQELPSLAATTEVISSDGLASMSQIEAVEAGERTVRIQKGAAREGDRWVVLALTCVVMTGIYYSLDIPAALHQQLKDYMPKSSSFEFEFNLLYTVYSIPNIILPFLGGYFVDVMGAPICLGSFAALCLVGQVLFAVGTASKSWAIMLAGRTIYGFGGESICVAYSTLLSQWFAGQEVALAFGIALAISRLGSVFNNLVSPVVANAASTPWAVWTGVILNTVSVLTALVIWRIDFKSRNALVLTEPTIDSLTEPLLADDCDAVYVGDNPVADPTQVTEPATARLSDVLRFGPLFWLLSLSCLVVYGCVLPFNNVASGILLERNYFKAPPKDCTLQFPDRCTSGTLQNVTNPSHDTNGNTCPSNHFAPVLPSSINKTGAFYLESLTVADVDCSVAFWAQGCTKDYCDAQHRATETAGRIMSIPYFISASLSPLLGHVVDKIGKRPIIASLASVMLICVHMTLGLSDSSPVVPLIGQGIAYSLYAAVIWPSVTLTVDENLTGMAFGVITSIQNIGLALFPIVIAAIYNHSDHQYIPHVEMFFVACATLGALCGIWLTIMDRRSGNKLNGLTSSTPNHEEDGNME